MKIFPNYEEFAVRSVIKSIDGRVIMQAMTAALRFADETGYTPIPDDRPDLVSPSGARFRIPLLLPVDSKTGDNRKFKDKSLSVGMLPVPLMWQIYTNEGHKGSVIVGRIDGVEETETGLRNAVGVFDVGPFAREAERLVRNLFLRGVSADLDEFEGTVEHEEELSSDDAKDIKDNKIKNREITVDRARLRGATLVAKPAFQECIIMLEPEPSLSNGDEFLADGTYEDMLDDIDNELAALAASGAPVIPPRQWFTDPKLSGPTPLTIDDDGKVYGHIAAWNVDHIGLSRGTKPPRSTSKYAYFRTGVLRTDDGSDVAVGQLTLAGGHASMSASAADAVKHYDDTASAVADVTAGEDKYGIWVAGALRPDLTPSQVRAFRASAPSGDWRPIGRKLELVAVCAVNVPGFPTVRTMVAGGQLTALVAAGTAPLLALREETSLSTLEERIKRLENSDVLDLSSRKAELLERMKAFTTAKPEPVVDEMTVALAASARQRMAALSPAPVQDLSSRAEEIWNRFNNL